jgi:predicted RNA-binding Zn-ribbon protein involved in translation (DUF1610 family)
MTLTCPKCGQRIAVTVTAQQYEVRVACPRCGREIIVEVGVMGGVGPSEVKA